MREHCATVTMAGNSRTEDKPMKHQRMQSGFTLIELMIVVAIIGIVSGLAYPAFKEQLAKSRRADAKATLVGAPQFPSRLRVSPEPQMGSPLYDIRVVLKVENGVKKRDEYSVKATRRAGSAMANDRCGDFSIDHLGRKNVSDYSGFSSFLEANRVCWQ